MKAYGKSEEDLHTEKMIQCREIVKEIINFGVTEVTEASNNISFIT